MEFKAELETAVDKAPPWLWKELALACLERDFVRAAEMWAEGGSPTWEARLRFRAAEELIETGRRTDAEPQLEQALAFYRSVGGTFWVECAEALLGRGAKSKSA